jgi:hypothetical protein
MCTRLSSTKQLQQQQQQQQQEQQRQAPQAVAVVPVHVPVASAAVAVSKCNELKLEYTPCTSATSLVKLSLDEVTAETLTFIRVLDCDSSEVSMFNYLSCGVQHRLLTMLQLTVHVFALPAVLHVAN